MQTVSLLLTTKENMEGAKNERYHVQAKREKAKLMRGGLYFAENDDLLFKDAIH